MIYERKPYKGYFYVEQEGEAKLNLKFNIFLLKKGSQIVGKKVLFESISQEQLEKLTEKEIERYERKIQTWLSS